LRRRWLGRSGSLALEREFTLSKALPQRSSEPARRQLFRAIGILWIILPALSLYELQRHSGAIDAIRTGLMSLSSDKTLIALVIAWFFALFMEGAAGFGTPIALAAPLLVGLGFTPVVAVALPLSRKQAAASELGLPLLAMIAAQGFGAAAGNSVALHNILTGAATVGLQGHEGDILRKAGPICLACLVGGGLLALAVTLWFS
jgi:lactate permease